MGRNELINVRERIRRWRDISKTIPVTLHTDACTAATTTNGKQDGVGSSKNSSNDQSNHHNETNNANNDDDPFDCTELIVPPTHELVQNVLKEHVEEWRELDSRLIVTEQPVRGGYWRKQFKPKKESSTCISEDNADHDNTPLVPTNNIIENTHKDDDENNQSVIPTSEPQPTTDGDYAASNNWIWNQNRIKLPDFFDYTCKGEPPQPPPNPTNLRRKVISLDDPTQHLDYECELWKIFKDVPLATEIEKEAVEGHACVETMKIRNEIEEGMKDYSRMDAHALSRLRKRERHHWPRINLPTKKKKKRSRGNQEWTGLGDICGATIRVESWRRQLKRGSGCDPNRCEVELLESQTLLDLHNVLVTCAQDDLFTYGRKREVIAESDNGQNLGGGGETLDGANDDSFNGYFFIEDTFYTHGDVDYVTPIIEWLNEEVTCDANRGKKRTKSKGKKRKNASSFVRSRREYLGIDRDVELKILPMKDMKLVDLSFRLASRYVHVFNGDCESAIFFSDVSMRMSNENIKESKYPLVHDIFTTTTCISTIQDSATCQACERGSAIVMTLNDEMADGGPTLFCAVCYAKLHYNKDGTELLYNNFEVVPLSVLQNLRDLCVGNDTIDSLF